MYKPVDLLNELKAVFVVGLPIFRLKAPPFHFNIFFKRFLFHHDTTLNDSVDDKPFIIELELSPLFLTISRNFLPQLPL
jgi:hypothetical protein